MAGNFSFVGRYLWWHYTTAVSDLTKTGKTLVWFVGHFFSFGTLIRTLFNPWKRMGEKYPSVIDFWSFFEVLLVNTLMRIVGTVTRLALIVIGAVALFFSVLLYALSFVLWFLAPFIIAGIAALGAYLLLFA
ncbi:MAG: hypothetical protein HGA67_01340 [Candidatus Yonathbacteria bacterium]|nr:hypothetical protein [Candidatus Yonathbacteria bacterium]